MVISLTGQLSSPLATGGAGVIFEYRLAAIMFSRLLRGGHVPIGIQLPIVRVALQQRTNGSIFDDIVLETGDHGRAPSIEIQVKRSLRVTGSDPEFIKVMSEAIDVCQTRREELSDGLLLMGLAARESGSELRELGELTEIARSLPGHVALDSLLRQGVTNSRVRARYEHVANAVATAASVDDGLKIKSLTYQILSGLYTWPVQVDPDGRDWRFEIDMLAGLAADAGCSPAEVIAHLCSLAEEFGPRAGQVDGSTIRRALMSRFGINIREPRKIGKTKDRKPTTQINISNHGSGTIIAGQNQVFYGSISVPGGSISRSEGEREHG
jgi:hypothetical protein